MNSANRREGDITLLPGGSGAYHLARCQKIYDLKWSIAMLTAKIDWVSSSVTHVYSWLSRRPYEKCKRVTSRVFWSKQP